MSTPVTSSNSPLPLATQVSATPKLIEGFSVSGNSAVKNFKFGGQDLKISIRLPNNLDDEAIKGLLKKYDAPKMDFFGKTAISAGVGTEATAISFKNAAEGRLTDIERHLKDGKSEKLNDAYFREKKTSIERANSPQKQTELQKLQDLQKSIKDIENIWKELPKVPSQQVPRERKEAREEESLPRQEVPAARSMHSTEAQREVQLRKPLPLRPEEIKTQKFFEKLDDLEKERLDINKNWLNIGEIDDEEVKEEALHEFQERLEEYSYELKDLMNGYDPTGELTDNFYRNNPEGTLSELHAHLHDLTSKPSDNQEESNEKVSILSPEKFDDLDKMSDIDDSESISSDFDIPEENENDIK